MSELRYSTLARIARGMRELGLTASEIAPSLRAVNAGRCQPTVPDGDLLEIIHEADGDGHLGEPFPWGMRERANGSAR